MAHITDTHPDGDRLDISSVWAEKELIRQVPGARWDTRRKTWHVPKSWAACIQLRGVFGSSLSMDDSVRAWALTERERADRSMEIHKDIETDAVEHDKLFSYQKACVAWLETTLDGALLANDMGTGKTATTLATIDRAGPEAFPAVVICPNSVKHHWSREAAVWCPDTTPYIIGGGAVKRRKALAAAAADPTALVIINFESLRLHSRLAPYGSVRLVRCVTCGGDDPNITTTKCEVHERELNTLGFKTVVIDECHRGKDPKSKQTRALWAISHGDTVRNRIALTGTPIANHVGDLWSIMHTIAPHEYPVRSSFMDRYAMLSWNAWGGMDVSGVRPDTKDELFRILDPRFRRITKDRVLAQLPPKIRTVREAVMTPKMAKAYRELESELVTRLESGEILFAPDSLAASLRLLQLSSSYGTIEADGSYRLCEPSPKLDVLDEILDELDGKPVAVCALSRQLIELASKRLSARSIPHGLITGSVTELERNQALDDFQNGRSQALLFTIQAGGTGLTMTAADTIVFLQRSWSLLENRQSEDRVHRIGSEIHEAINVIDVVAPDTIEERQIARLHEKLRRLNEITRDGESVFDGESDDLREEL